MDPKGFGRKDNSASLMAMGVTRPCIGMLWSQHSLADAQSLFIQLHRLLVAPQGAVAEGKAVGKPKQIRSIRAQGFFGLLQNFMEMGYL